jgi:hypothetical protein
MMPDHPERLDQAVKQRRERQAQRQNDAACGDANIHVESRLSHGCTVANMLVTATAQPTLSERSNCAGVAVCISASHAIRTSSAKFLAFILSVTLAR